MCTTAPGQGARSACGPHIQIVQKQRDHRGGAGSQIRCPLGRNQKIEIRTERNSLDM